MTQSVYKNLSSGRWHTFSLSEQLANIGSEFNRTLYWHENINKENKEKSFNRLLELVDLTISDKRWKGRIWEILRLREIVCDLFIGNNKYNISLNSLKNYFLYFGIMVNTRRR